MHHLKPRQLVGLHEREGRARHLGGFVLGEVTDQGAREGGLAGAEIARQRDHVAGPQRIGDVDREPARGVLVRQRHREARAAGEKENVEGHEICGAQVLSRAR